MKNVIQILYVHPITGTSRKTGNAYDMRAAQCVIEKVDANGQPAPMIGELMLPDAYKDITPGRYDVEFEIAIGSDKRVGSRVSKMTLIPRGGSAAGAAAAAAGQTAIA